MKYQCVNWFESGLVDPTDFTGCAKRLPPTTIHKSMSFQYKCITWSPTVLTRNSDMFNLLNMLSAEVAWGKQNDWTTG